MHVRVIQIISLLCLVTTVCCQGPRKIGPGSVYIQKILHSEDTLLHDHDADDGVIMMLSRRLLEDAEFDEENGESVGNELIPLSEENPQHKKKDEAEEEEEVVQESDKLDKEELGKDVEPISLSQKIKEKRAESNPMKKVENKTDALDGGGSKDEIGLGSSSDKKGTVGITEINKEDAKKNDDNESEHKDDNIAPIHLDVEQKNQEVSDPVHILSKEVDEYDWSSNTTAEVEEQQGKNVVSEIAAEVPSSAEEDKSSSKSVSHLVHTTSKEEEGYEVDDQSSKTTTEVEEWESEIVTNGATAVVHNVSKEEDRYEGDDQSSKTTTEVEERESKVTTNGGSAHLYHNASKEEDGYEGDDRSSKTTSQVEEEESETTANGGSAPLHKKSQEEDEYEGDDRSSKTSTNVEEQESETSTNGGSALEGGEFGDFMEDFTGLGSKFHNTAQRVAQHLRPDLERLSSTSKLYFNIASQKMVQRFLPLIGTRYAPWVAYLISYSLPLLPLLIVFKLFQHIRVLLSLQKVLLFINIYLTAYFVTLMLASVALGSEPMTFFHHNSLPGYIYLQLLQALAYLIYLVLHTSHIVDSYSSPSCTLPGKISATVQWVVSHFIGLHYYVTVFHPAMDLRPPHTNWKNYGAYSIAFFTLCLFARVKRLKKEYLPLGDDEDTTDKMN